MSIHKNSLAAYIEIIDDGTKETRALMVLECIRKNPCSTAREIKNLLELKDMNDVAPRLTELKQSNLIKTGDKRVCTHSHKKVSTFLVNIMN